MAVRRRLRRTRRASRPPRRRVRLDKRPADGTTAAGQTRRSGAVPNADARDGLVPRRLRAPERSVFAPRPVARRAAGSPESVRPLRKDFERLYALDVFRGLAVASMILVSAPGTWTAVYWPLDHAIWNGWTPTDLVFPSFLFAMGAAVPLAAARRESRSERWRHSIRRALVLLALGLLLNVIE